MRRIAGLPSSCRGVPNMDKRGIFQPRITSDTSDCATISQLRYFSPALVLSRVWLGRYTGVEATEKLGTDGPDGVGETRPCVLCEYSHAMGNSNGNLHKYWEVCLALRSFTYLIHLVAPGFLKAGWRWTT